MRYLHVEWAGKKLLRSSSGHTFAPVVGSLSRINTNNFFEIKKWAYRLDVDLFQRLIHKNMNSVLINDNNKYEVIIYVIGTYFKKNRNDFFLNTMLTANVEYLKLCLLFTARCSILYT